MDCRSLSTDTLRIVFFFQWKVHRIPHLPTPFLLSLERGKLEYVELVLHVYERLHTPPEQRTPHSPRRRTRVADTGPLSTRHTPVHLMLLYGSQSFRGTRCPTDSRPPSGINRRRSTTTLTRSPYHLRIPSRYIRPRINHKKTKAKVYSRRYKFCVKIRIALT